MAFLEHNTYFYNSLPFLGLFLLLSLHPVKSVLTFKASHIFSDTFSPSIIHFGA